MDSIRTDMKIMAKLGDMNHEKLARLLFSSYKARVENLKKLGIIPKRSTFYDLNVLLLLFLQDRGYIADTSHVKPSSTESRLTLEIIDMITDSDLLKEQQNDLLRQLHRKSMSSEKRAEKIQLIEDIEAQLEKHDDFIRTFCRHIRSPRNEQIEMMWSSFVRNKTVDRILNEGNELIRKGPKVHYKEQREH